jgi:hypothetical protein
MLSRDIDVTVLVVVVAGVYEFVFVSAERNVLDSKAERMFARAHVWA